MEGFQIRGWDLILPGSCWLYEPQPLNQQSASVVGGSTPCGAVSNRGTNVFVPVRRSCRCMAGFGSGGATFPSPGQTGPRRSPEEQLPPCAPRLLIGGERADGGARPMGWTMG